MSAAYAYKLGDTFLLLLPSPDSRERESSSGDKPPSFYFFFITIFHFAAPSYNEACNQLL